MITIYYRAVDGFRDRRNFKTLKGAQRYAQDRIGKYPGLGLGYAVSNDGVGSISVDGDVDGTTICIRDLFPGAE